MAVWIVFGAGSIERIDLLAQHRALQGATGFTRFVDRQAVRQEGVLEKIFSCLVIVLAPSRLAIVLAAIMTIEQAGEEVGDVVATRIDARVEPGPSQDRAIAL